MQIIGTVIASAIILGLIIFMGKMSERGVDINKQFCTGNCSGCGLAETAEELEICAAGLPEPEENSHSPVVK